MDRRQSPPQWGQRMSLLALNQAVVQRGKRVILDRLDLTLEAGELVALVGPNGSGKTTALRALLGLIPVLSGSATIGGADVRSLDPIRRARQVAYLPQSRPMAWAISVQDAVALGRFAYGGSGERLSIDDQAAVDQAIAACDLEALKDRAVTNLSGGELARVHMARALATQAPALLADEPTAALDPRHQWQVMQVLAQQAKRGGGVMVVVHDLALAAAVCSRIVLIKDGKVLANGTPFDVLTPDNIGAAYGVQAHWHQDGQTRHLIMGAALS
jgi:iron complex transport system ATP-binding protein